MKSYTYCFAYIVAYFMVMIRKFWTNRSGQTVQTHIRLLMEESLIRVFTVCYISLVNIGIL